MGGGGRYMTRKGKDLEIISISLPESTAKDVDRVVTEMGYPSRSELIRDAVRALIKSKVEMDDLEGTIEGVAIILYDHAAAQGVSKIRHEFMHVFRSFMHSDFNSRARNADWGSCKCCEVLFFSGDAAEVRKAWNMLRSIKHVEESSIFLA